MSKTTLAATTGRATGSAASRRLRAEGKIPGVLYGHGMEPVSLAIVRRDLRIALSGPAGVNTVLSLDVDGKPFNAVVKEMQRHPVKRVEVVTTPANMPAEFVVDITDMEPDTVIRLADLKLPAGVTTTGDPDMPIVTVLYSAPVEEASTDGEDAEGAADDAGE